VSFGQSLIEFASTRFLSIVPKKMTCIIPPRKMLNLQHQHNNHTTTPHMMVDPTHWDPPSCEGLL